MPDSKKKIEEMNEEELKELIEKAEKTMLSDAAQTIIKKNKAGPDELEILRKFRKGKS